MILSKKMKIFFILYFTISIKIIIEKGLLIINLLKFIIMKLFLKQKGLKLMVREYLALEERYPLLLLLYFFLLLSWDFFYKVIIFLKFFFLPIFQVLKFFFLQSFFLQLNYFFKQSLIFIFQIIQYHYPKHLMHNNLSNSSILSFIKQLYLIKW